MSGFGAHDQTAHERTYAAFLSLTKWGTGAVVVVLCLMGIFLLPH